MTHKAKQWQRNIDGLLASAKIKTEQTKQRAEEAIAACFEHRSEFATVRDRRYKHAWQNARWSPAAQA